MSGVRQNSNAADEPFGVEQGSSVGGPVGLTENEKLMACLSYASQLILPAVLPIILLLTEEYKRSPFVRHHAVHSLALLAATIIYELAMVGVFALASAVVACLACAVWLLFLVPVGAFIYYAVVALKGRSPEVPYLTKFLKDSNWL